MASVQLLPHVLVVSHCVFPFVISLDIAGVHTAIAAVVAVVQWVGAASQALQLQMGKTVGHVPYVLCAIID